MVPLIGITCNVMEADCTRPIYRGKELHYVDRSLSDAVIRAGGLPLLIPVAGALQHLSELSGALDGLLLSSGMDVNPDFYGEKPSGLFRGWTETEERDRLEIQLLHSAADCGCPVLGICRGMQVINVALGGSLVEHLAEGEERLVHRDQAAYDANRHPVCVAEGSLLAEMAGPGEHSVVSVHHQGIKEIAPGLRPSARSSDGVVEALESKRRCLIGVQWHPEWMPGERAGDAVLDWLIREALKFGRAKIA